VKIMKRFGWASVLLRSGRREGLSVPDGPVRLPLELMSRQQLTSTYMGDLRVSARDTGLGRGRR
jgi:hypothetical protein